MLHPQRASIEAAGPKLYCCSSLPSAGTNYIETLRVQVHANCRIRRIYFSDRLYSEEELPPEFKLFLPIVSALLLPKPSFVLVFTLAFPTFPHARSFNGIRDYLGAASFSSRRVFDSDACQSICCPLFSARSKRRKTASLDVQPTAVQAVR